MYNGRAFVNTSDRKVPVYQLTKNEIDITNKQIGTIYPNECFGMHASEGNVSFIVFRNSSGGISRGGFGSVNPDYTPYCERKSNGKTLEKNLPDGAGLYSHTLSKNMNWYVGTHKQSTPLPKGTIIKIKSSCTTGADYPSRIFCAGYRKPGGKDVVKEFCIDFLTVGSMPSNRALL
ncbi:hypothetical protein SAMN02745247_02445 [Butyrivibrio hungatei DSM 14810]|uniref:Uncharacterized protein n=1 Tax=Butyrivibrio hungatei DSM 14810 TaxID=1121132 RepID=A0A1M7SUD5_9FIRM|nr:hypothetical protein [Butyrivibrio hungatei]SHN61996.1 hypothetical protein SAMN02745247_02445 [Butyrivibrio hungatei DSM 14810]